MEISWFVNVCFMLWRRLSLKVTNQGCWINLRYICRWFTEPHEMKYRTGWDISSWKYYQNKLKRLWRHTDTIEWEENEIYTDIIIQDASMWMEKDIDSIHIWKIITNRWWKISRHLDDFESRFTWCSKRIWECWLQKCLVKNIFENVEWKDVNILSNWNAYFTSISHMFTPHIRMKDKKHQ
jgi:hypothetical protein